MQVGIMAEITLNSEEVLRDNKDELEELFAEIIEDMAMERAIAEGETTELVSRETIFNILEP
ncbi:MAG: hypothetical protein GDA44_03255 [Prochloron sp. SP5CPC1]|nr:hypothetical protein [Candidatus Paraprochloron terpiosi SP5CPC1]